jgi:hypothetical protein
MTYELATKLKDAGFPLRKPGSERVHFEITHEIGQPSIFIYPTLSELIEACGDDFHQLLHITSNDLWFAEGFDTRQRETGSTPEEAVAKLWLALNGK